MLLWRNYQFEDIFLAGKIAWMTHLPTILVWLILLGSLGGLYLGGEVLVSGGVSLAKRAGIKRVVVGLTVVAVGTSMPEFFVSLFGALKGSPDISVGNVIGSNLANIGLALSIAVLIRKETGKFVDVTWDLTFLSGATLIFLFMSMDGKISRGDGLVLFLMLFLYILASARREGQEIEEEKSLSYPILLLISGIAILAVSAHYTVISGIELSKRMGISQLAIGMTAMALGTSLPEIFVSAVAAVKKEVGIGIGNVIGSNIFNLMGVAGGVAIIKPLDVNIRLVKVFIPASLIFALFLLFLSAFKIRLRRRHALLILVIYFVLVYNLFH